MPRKKIRVGNALMCDYVAKGDRNKHVLVNAYSGSIRFDAMPADFGFGLYIELPAQGLTKVSLSLRLDGEEFMMANASSEEGKDGVIVLPLIQMRVEKAATFTAVLSADQFISATAITKRMYATDPLDAIETIVSPPPSARSRRASPAS